MTYYHNSKQAAEAAGSVFESHFMVRAELEPGNGWVIVLNPRNQQSFEFPLLDILGKAEIDLSQFTRLRQRPAEFKPLSAKVEAIRKPRAERSDEPAPTWKPGAALPWAK